MAWNEPWTSVSSAEPRWYIIKMSCLRETTNTRSSIVNQHYSQWGISISSPSHLSYSSRYFSVSPTFNWLLHHIPIFEATTEADWEIASTFKSKYRTLQCEHLLALQGVHGYTMANGRIACITLPLLMHSDILPSKLTLRFEILRRKQWRIYAK